MFLRKTIIANLNAKWLIIKFKFFNIIVYKVRHIVGNYLYKRFSSYITNINSWNKRNSFLRIYIFKVPTFKIILFLFRYFSPWNNSAFFINNNLFIFILFPKYTIVICLNRSFLILCSKFIMSWITTNDNYGMKYCYFIFLPNTKTTSTWLTHGL